MIEVIKNKKIKRKIAIGLKYRITWRWCYGQVFFQHLCPFFIKIGWPLIF